MARFNPSLVYPVGKLSIRRKPGSGPKGPWEVLSARPNKEGDLPADVEVLHVFESGKLARVKANELQADSK
jgi:hypothetical protein